jgi:acyl-CoA hydrolase
MIICDPDQAVLHIAQQLKGTGGRVFVAAGGTEPKVFAQAYRHNPEAAAGLTFIGAAIPGVNHTDWASLHPTAKSEGIFVGADWRGSFESGRFCLVPQAYSQAWTWLATTPLDAALVQLSAPDADGYCSLGPSVDFQPAVLGRDLLRIAHINPNLPAPPRGHKIALSQFDIVVEEAQDHVAYDPGALDASFADIAQHVQSHIEDGAALQVGLGKMGFAVLQTLTDRKNLTVRSGMIIDPALTLIDCGAIMDTPDAIVTGIALGRADLIARMSASPNVRFAPVSETHNHDVLSAIPRFTAINSALELDLFGQANAEFLGRRQVSGIGGLTDFLRGAGRAPQGKPIIALNATAKGGTVSRIVPRLAQGTVSVPRNDVAIVATEFGSADLRGLSLDAKAQALIGLAAPQHRDGLEQDWRQMRSLI